MTKKKLHKTILALMLVLIPPYFLVFTDEGRRVADNAVLWVVGGESIELNLRELDGQFTKDEIIKIFPDLEWQCESRATPFGDALCASEITAFNSYPSRYLTMFFVGSRVNAMKVAYRQPYHEQILGHLLEQLGQPSNVADAVKATPDADNVLEWHTNNGTVVMQKHLQESDEPAFLWFAPSSAPAS